MAERKKLAIIDGKSVFYRGYYALPNLSTGQGIPTGGVYGFATMALELIKKLKPDYVAVAWDKPKTNIRKRLAMYPQYKAGRKAAPPDFYTQIPILHELLEAFGWPLYELDDYEADDIMGTLAVKAEKEGLETLLITSDLDMLQLVNHRVKVYALKRGFSNIEEFHPQSFEAKYGLKATQFLDLKSLKGDSSDNIPGVPGVGEKTAIELLKQYETLDGVYKNLADVKESTRKKLEAGKDSAYLSKKIGAIWCDAPLKLDLKAMDGKHIDAVALQTLLQKLEFRSLLRNLPDNMKSDAPAESNLHLKLPQNTLINSDKALNVLQLPKVAKLFIHSRASGKHGADPQALIIGTSEQIYTFEVAKLSPKLFSAKLQPITDAKLVGYDVKADIKLLQNLGVSANQVEHDVLVGAFLINSLQRFQNLAELAAEGLGYSGLSLDNLPTEDFLASAPELIAIIAKLYQGQVKALGELPKVKSLAEKVEWPLIPVLARMELAGIKLDTKYLAKLNKQLDKSIAELEKQIYKAAGKQFNIGSPAQLAEILFSTLNLPTAGIKKTKTGYSTGAGELAKLRSVHPIADLITQYREVAKLKNTYVDTLPKQVDENSRLHTTFSLTIAATGRLSSSDPNLQNIPVKTDLGRSIRTAFVAGQGNALVSADYSQFELRLAAALSGEEEMIEAFNHDADIHVETAAAVYDIPADKVTKAQRSSVKEINFGIMYGLGPHALSESTDMSFSEARDFIKRYFEIRPRLKSYIEHLRNVAKEQGYVETLLGRRRPTPDVHSSNAVVREAAYRAAVNMPLQGTAADIMKLAMVQIAAKLDDDCQTLLQIHDSLILEVPKAKAQKVGELVKHTMESTYKLPVKLKADISIGKNWGEL